MGFVLVMVLSYSLGCLVGAYYVVRLSTGADVRMLGSGTAGARNVLRTAGARSAFLTLVVDVSKGAVAVWLAPRLLPTAWAGGLAFIGVVAGHVWPAQLGFRGGKGAAPALGCVLALHPLTAALALTTGAVALLASRHLTASGLVAVTATPVLHAMLGATRPETVGVLAACGIVLYAHRPGRGRRHTGVPLPPRAAEGT